jgi:hypothetical protein
MVVARSKNKDSYFFAWPVEMPQCPSWSFDWASAGSQLISNIPDILGARFIRREMP